MEDLLKNFGGTENILNAIKSNALKLGQSTTKMMLEMYYVLKSPQTSAGNKAIIVAALGYQLLPKDLLPRKRFGILGFLDNGVTLAVAYKKVKSSITPEIEQQVEETISKWFSSHSQAHDATEQ